MPAPAPVEREIGPGSPPPGPRDPGLGRGDGATRDRIRGWAVRNRGISVAMRYGSAVLAVAAGMVLTRGLWPMIRPNPFLLFFTAIVAVAWSGGLGPGLLATVLSVAVCDYFFIEPFYDFHPLVVGEVRISLFLLA